MEDNFDLRKFLIENKVNESEENNGGFEAFKNTVKGILKDEGVDLENFEDIVTIEGLIEFWAQEAETNFYGHTKEDMVTLSKEADLDFGDQEALFNTDEVNSLERGGIEGEEELDENASPQFHEETIGDLKNLDSRLKDKKFSKITGTKFTSQKHHPNIITISYKEKEPFGQSGGESVNVRFIESEKQELIDYLKNYLAQFNYNLGDINESQESEFPITTIEQLRDFYRKDYFKVVGEEDDRDIDKIADGSMAADLEEEMFARDVILGMKEGKYTDAESTSKFIAKLADEYYG